MRRDRDREGRRVGKPADIIAKMVEGAIAKYRKEHALVSQLFVMDGKTKISDVVAKAGKDAGAEIKLEDYVRFQLGEGIEKEQSDFAAEVAAASACRRHKRTSPSPLREREGARGRLAVGKVGEWRGLEPHAPSSGPAGPPSPRGEKDTRSGLRLPRHPRAGGIP